MNRIKCFLLLASLLVLLSGCNKNDTVIADNYMVDQFIESLQAGDYNAMHLPYFTYKDIPALLKYRNNQQIISNFPNNPISSYALLECRMGMYVLWTIESIRAVSIDESNLVMNFPSQNPLLALRQTEELTMVSDESSHHIAAEAYYGWWENNKKKNFDRFKHIDPLKDTDFKWK